MAGRELFKHQKAAIERCLNVPARLVCRAPGTGKTLIALEIIKHKMALGGTRYLWVSPASIIPQSLAVAKAEGLPAREAGEGVSGDGCVFVSYEYLRLHLGEFLRGRWDCVICDEFHRVKNSRTQSNAALWQLRKAARTFYAFTGTPFQNTPYEFFEQVSLTAGKDLSWQCEKTLRYKRPAVSFWHNLLRRLGLSRARLNQGPIIGVKDPAALRQAVAEYVDFLPEESYRQECHLPNVVMHFDRVSMSAAELGEYRLALRGFRKKKYREFLNDDLSDSDTESCFNGLMSLRRSLLLPGSSKISRCVAHVCELAGESERRTLVFCNFVEHGLAHLSRRLEQAGIAFASYDGTVSAGVRKKLLVNYQSGNIPLLLLSPVGFEGLDLYGTTDIIVLDPHYNPDRTRQLVSRAIRAYSRVRTLNVHHYIAVTGSEKILSVDEKILAIAERKKRVAGMIEACLTDN